MCGILLKVLKKNRGKKLITFKELDLQEDVLKALDKLGFEHPTEIQAQSIPVIKEGKDMIGQAQTGTGKTFSFAIPIIEKN